MNIEKILITVTADDRPGVVQKLSDLALAHKANWLESSLSHLCGQFVGIVQLAVAAEHREALIESLAGLANIGIYVTVKENSSPEIEELGGTIELYVEANDRPGIVEEITSAIAQTAANVEQLETWRESASMAGYDLFIAQLAVSLPKTSSIDDLEAALEAVSADVMVSITEE